MDDTLSPNSSFCCLSDAMTILRVVECAQSITTESMDDAIYERMTGLKQANIVI